MILGDKKNFEKKYQRGWKKNLLTDFQLNDLN